MRIIGKILAVIKSKYEPLSRRIYVKSHYKKLRNRDFSIISQNCWGGVLTQDLGMPYTSPTCNLYFTASDFVKFCENMKYYLSLEMVECDKKAEHIDVAYPVGKLDDIYVYFVHYKTFEEAKWKWTHRIERINFDNLFLAMTDRDGGTDCVLERYAKLPYSKVYFSHIPHPVYDCVCYIPGFEDQPQVDDVTQIINLKGQRLTDPYFDPIKFLNRD